MVELAETPDQIDAAEQLIQEAERQSRESANHVVATLAQVAEFFGLSEPTVRQWTQRNPPLPGKQGAWPLKEIVAWRWEVFSSKRRPPTEEETLFEAAGPESMPWADKWTRARALLSEAELKQREGELVELSQIVPVLKRAATVFSDGIRRLESEHGRAAADVMRTPLERMREQLEDLG